jgi:hypothetical protein
MGLLASSNHWLISLINLIDLISFNLMGLFTSLASAASSDFWLIRLVGLVSLSIHQLFCHCLLTTSINAAIRKMSRQPKQAAATLKLEVATSANKVANAAELYFCATSSCHLNIIVREIMCWWLAPTRKKMLWWIASFG